MKPDVMPPNPSHPEVSPAASRLSLYASAMSSAVIAFPWATIWTTTKLWEGVLR